tara:strand:+ start:1117 stop:1590 length:474 start_codon:yes stop_codon:yes gene_type:complete
MINHKALVSLFLILIAGCDEPFTVLAGAELSGTEAPAPQDWSETDKFETMQLETRPTQPYSINLWAASSGENIYIATGERGTNWTDYIQENSQVRLRANQTIYRLHASPVIDPVERNKVSLAFAKKYDLDMEDHWVMEAKIYRLNRKPEDTGSKIAK